MTHLAALPNSPLVAELATRMAERLADLKGAYTNHYTPPAPRPASPCDVLLLPGTLSLAP
jgi:hypothetical protein